MCINEAETRIALATVRTRSPRCQSCRVFQTKRSRATVKVLFISCQIKKVNDTGSWLETRDLTVLIKFENRTCTLIEFN